MGSEMCIRDRAPATGTADIKMDRLIRNAEQLLRWWKFQRKLKEAAEGIDVLTQGSEAMRSGSTEIVRAAARGAVGVLAQQAPAGGVAVEMRRAADGPDLTVAERSCHGQVRH